jgi:hypothetical protein
LLERFAGYGFDDSSQDDVVRVVVTEDFAGFVEQLAAVVPLNESGVAGI